MDLSTIHYSSLNYCYGHFPLTQKSCLNIAQHSQYSGNHNVRYCWLIVPVSLNSFACCCNITFAVYDYARFDENGKHFVSHIHMILYTDLSRSHYSGIKIASQWDKNYKHYITQHIRFVSHSHKNKQLFEEVCQT